MRFAVILAALAGGAGLSSAASIVTVYTSINGGSFTAGHRLVLPGDVVRARYVCQTDNPAAVGLAGFSYFPQVSNWRAGDDSLAPWTTPASSSDTSTPGVNGPGVRDHGTGHGRLAPFAAPASTSVPTTTVTAGTLQMGGTAAGGAVAIGQLSPDLSTNASGNFFSMANPATIFQFAFTVGAGHGAGTTLTITGEFPTSIGRARWYDSMTGATIVDDGAPTLHAGTLTVVPAPGVLALAGLAAMVPRRRR